MEHPLEYTAHTSVSANPWESVLTRPAVLFLTTVVDRSYYIISARYLQNDFFCRHLECTHIHSISATKTLRVGHDGTWGERSSLDHKVRWQNLRGYDLERYHDISFGSPVTLRW